MTFRWEHAPTASDAPVLKLPGHRRGDLLLGNEAPIATLPQPPLSLGVLEVQ